MTPRIPESHPLSRMFQGLAEHAFVAELGVADPALVSYVADLLARFVPSTELWRLRGRDGRRLDQVALMVAEAESSHDESRRRDCHRHVGDYTLFWTGVYPEALNSRQARRSIDCLIDYQRQGKRSYYLVSTYEGDAKHSDLFRRLSDEFEICAIGLSKVRKEWERAALG